MPQTARYLAHAAGSGRSHLVEATSFETAALAFTEDFVPQVDDDDAIRVIVQAADGGPEHCFVVHLDDGAIEGCR